MRNGFNTVGIILRRYPLGEKDKLLVILSPQFGKLRVSARGARQSSSKLAGTTEPLVIANMHLVKGMTFHVLAQAECIETFPQIKQDITWISYASFLCELVERLTVDEDPAADLYEILVQSLYLLTVTSDAAALILAAQWHILHLSGYLPSTRECCVCSTNVSTKPDHLQYSPIRGGAVCERCSDGFRGELLPFHIETQRALHAIGNLTSTGDWSRFTLTEDTKSHLWTLVRAHMKSITDRDVKTITFLDALRFDTIG